MKKFSFNGNHITISICIFVLSLAFPAYYMNKDYESVNSLLVLGLGWLGIFDWQFSWLANLFFFLALLYRTDLEKSATLGMVSLAFAISFLFYKEVLTGLDLGYEKIHKEITGYGWGYFLWIISIAILLIGQSNCAASKSKLMKTALYSFPLIGISTVFIYHFYVSDNGAHEIHSERNVVFDKMCPSAKDIIYKKIPEEVDSVYLRNVSRVELRGNVFGFWWINGTGSAESSIPGISFYEEDNRHTHRKEDINFLYMSSEQKTRKATYSDTLKSRYMIEGTRIPFAEHLGIRGEKIEIIDLQNNTVVAETSYFYQKKGGRLCGEISGLRFSNTDFFRRVFTQNKRQ